MSFGLGHDKERVGSEDLNCARDLSNVPTHTIFPGTGTDGQDSLRHWSKANLVFCLHQRARGEAAPAEVDQPERGAHVESKEPTEMTSQGLARMGCLAPQPGRCSREVEAQGCRVIQGVSERRIP